MKHIFLGSTGMRIHPLVYGTLPLGPLQAGLSPAEGGRLIRYALERGVTMIDTAELYGTYDHVREALRGCGGAAQVVSKTHANNAADARAHVERAMRETGRECLEVVHLHGARIRDPFVERREVLDALLEMKEEGKIAHVGLSSHYISAVRKAAEHPEIEVIHPLINRTGMGILDGSSEEMAAAIALCAGKGKGVYAMKALAGGNLIASARENIRYVLGLAGVQALALGMLSETEIDANISLVTGGNMDEKMWERLEQGKRRLRIMEKFCKGCGACVTACTADALYLEEGRARVNEEACILCGYCGASCPEFIIRVI